MFWALANLSNHEPFSLHIKTILWGLDNHITGYIRTNTSQNPIDLSFCALIVPHCIKKHKLTPYHMLLDNYQTCFNLGITNRSNHNPHITHKAILSGFDKHAIGSIGPNTSPSPNEMSLGPHCPSVY